MEYFEEIKVLVFLFLLASLLIWSIWKDINFKQKISEDLNELVESRKDLNKEIESLILEIDENSKKIEFLSGYLKRLDQNASRLADNIQGEQSMSKAIEMARSGKDHLEIIKETGLSNEEVEAIIHSHKEQ
tara:strand:- start:1082 stop:1474 length:393 start_codon:yes stop_codon:yes gene_type:complete